MLGDIFKCPKKGHLLFLYFPICHIFWDDCILLWNKILLSCFLCHPGQGRCVCGACVCHPAFRGRTCECPLSLESCLSQDKQICAGRGDCHCGTCICHDKRFRGPTCELCPSCPDVCTLHKLRDLFWISNGCFSICWICSSKENTRELFVLSLLLFFDPTENASYAGPFHSAWIQRCVRPSVPTSTSL